MEGLQQNYGVPAVVSPVEDGSDFEVDQTLAEQKMRGKAGMGAASSAGDAIGPGPAGSEFQIWSKESHACCTECEDTRATVLCVDCEEDYCSLCWAALHRRGLRAKHTTEPLVSSAEALAPPPEALEESGWLAGVWPTHRPTPDSPADLPSRGGDPQSGDDEESFPESVGQKGGDRSEANVSEETGVKRAGQARGVRSAVNGHYSKGGERKSGSFEASSNGPLLSNGSSHNGVHSASQEGDVSKKVGPENGDGSLPPARVEALTRTDSVPPRREQLTNGHAKAPAGNDEEHGVCGKSEGRSSTPSAADGKATQHAEEEQVEPTSPASKRGRRPEGFEGPLCPTGLFFSKPQDEDITGTPPAVGDDPPHAKRARPAPPRLDIAAGNGSNHGDVGGGGDGRLPERRTILAEAPGVVGSSLSGDLLTSNGVSANSDGRRAKGGSKTPLNGNGVRDDNRGENGDGNRALPQTVGSKVTDRDGERGANGSGSCHTNGNGISFPSAVDSASPSYDAEQQQQRENGVSSSSRSGVIPSPLSGVTGAPAASALERVGVESSDTKEIAGEAPFDESRAVLRSGNGVIDEEQEVGPAREPTEQETKALADLVKRAHTVPLRLDARERLILGVLEGALHHVQYTDEVDRVMRGSRLKVVLEHLKKVFTSMWGMFKASGVSAPACAAPGKPPAFRPNLKNKFGPLPCRALISNAGEANGVPTAGGRGGVVGGGAGEGVVEGDARVAGAAAYREDSFAMTQTNQGYTRDWVCAVRTACEVGRRHKILNPDKMRGAHGMLMYIVMDSEHPIVREHTGISCERHIRTVHGLASSSKLLPLLSDPDILLASRPVLPWSQGQRVDKSDGDSERLAAEAKEKEEARKRLIRRHGGGGLECEVSLLVDSLADSIVYREISTRPIRRMIALLKTGWRPDRLDEQRRNASLEIRSGLQGARLNHSHKRQFYYVLQSLYLWLEIVDNTLDLWQAGEKDMLQESNQYNLTNTGQGVQRVQAAMTVGRLMGEYQRIAAAKSGMPWVGSAVVHLGDHCVPNALVFLDKYSQIPWILNPVLQAVDYVSDLEKGQYPAVLEYVKDRWVTTDYAKRYILRNFFRYAFDGSGGDNNYDAGSCIDGRLTSTWNWCSKIEKKSYYPVFKLSGFNGFDGNFSR